MYLQNKYTLWYNNIIERAKTRKLPSGIYLEKHHVIPRSLGGTDVINNIVKLTAKEHFVCHLLLTKMTTGLARRSMAYAAWRMTHIDGRKRYVPSSKIYEFMRKNLSESYKGVKKTSTWWKDKKHSIKSRQKQSEVKSGSNNPMWGRNHKVDSIRRIKEKQMGVSKPKFICPNCLKEVGGKSNFLRWHGDNCSTLKKR